MRAPRTKRANAANEHPAFSSTTEINRIAQASARARIVTGATE